MSIRTALLAAAALAGMAAGSALAAGEPLAVAPVTRGGEAGAIAFEGVVQAVRQTVIAAQVSGAVVGLEVRAGDRVQAGQLLLKLDARAAEQAANAAAAQVTAARAAQDAATREFQRQKELFARHYISQAALDRAEEQFKSTTAAAAAQLASAEGARTQSGFFVVRAPYAGVVSEVAVVLGDMAMPGRPLLTLYDPSAMRVAANIPQSAAAALGKTAKLFAEVPGATPGRIAPVATQLLPALDPATHTQELRLDLPRDLPALPPGSFARAWLPATAGDGARLYIPAKAVLRRTELTAVYVLGADNKPRLRQVRLGRVEGERVEVLSGLNEGERVVLDPQAATRAS